MLTSRLKNIQQVLKIFTGDGEPHNDREKYILNSMWVMLFSEFEGSIKDLAENYINFVIKKKSVKDMHVCFLLQNFYGNKKDKDEFTKAEIMGLFKREKSKISISNFTRNKKPTYKSFTVEHLFNSLGVFLKEQEKTNLKLLDGIASTRDSISHGDYHVSITRKELEESIKTVKKIYKMLKTKLK